MALAPGAADGGARRPRPPARSSRVDAELPARGALRRRRARSCPSSRRSRRRATGGWARTRTPTAASLLRDLRLPDFRSYAVDVAEARHDARARPTRVLGAFLRDVIAREPATTSGSSAPTRRPRTGSSAVFEVDRPRRGTPRRFRSTSHLAPDGRVMEVLSEHQCQGWLEGYLLTGRHGLFNCYEAFIHIVDSMVNQHAKWLKVTREIPWRRPLALAQLPPELARLAAGPQRLLPPGSRVHRPRRQQEGRDHPRLPAAGRQHAALGGRPLPAQPALRQRRSSRASSRRSTFSRWTRRSSTAPAGVGIWDWASNDEGGEPDVVLGCSGDVPTLETLAAAAILREHLPDLRVRVVNVVDLMRLQPAASTPTASPTPSSTRSSRRTSRSSSPTTATRGSSTGSPTGGRTTTTCTCAVTRRRARPPRRSTWS